MNVDVRLYHPGDEHFFKSMFYESLFVPPGSDAFPLAIIDEPHLAKYHKEWGSEGDCCHIAEVEGERIGAVWTRYFTSENPGYAYVSDDVPEIGIALLPQWTGKGIGTKLIRHHLAMLKVGGCNGVSLSADVRNRAVKLYASLGFTETKREGFSLVMVTELESSERLSEKSILSSEGYGINE